MWRKKIYIWHCKLCIALLKAAHHSTVLHSLFHLKVICSFKLHLAYKWVSCLKGELASSEKVDTYTPLCGSLTQYYQVSPKAGNICENGGGKQAKQGGNQAVSVLSVTCCPGVGQQLLGFNVSYLKQFMLSHCTVWQTIEEMDIQNMPYYQDPSLNIYIFLLSVI